MRRGADRSTRCEGNGGKTAMGEWARLELPKQRACQLEASSQA